MIRYIFIVLIMISFGQLKGQIDTAVGQIDSLLPSISDTIKKIKVDEVQVIKSFEVKLGEAKRIGLGPVPKKVVPHKNSYDYDVTIAPAIIIYKDPVIKPLAMNPDPKKDVDNFFAKLGYGNLKSPYGDLSYFRQVPELYEFTVSAHHYGLDNTAKANNQKYNETALKLSGKYLLGENTLLSAGLAGNLENRMYYGSYDPRGFEDTLTIKNNIYQLDLGVGTAETTENGLDASFSFGATYQKVNFGFAKAPNEIDLKPRGNVSKKLSERLTIGLEANAYITNLKTVDLSNNNITLEANPKVEYHNGIFNISAGADLINDNEGFSPFADVELGVKIGNGLQAYAGTDQEIMRNNLSTSMNRNPYVVLDIENIKNSIVKRIYGGLRGRLLSMVHYDISAGYEDIKDHYFYIYDGDETPTFNLGYTDLKNVSVDANVVFNINETTQVGGVFSHNFYDIADQEDLYNVPSYRYEAFTKVGFFDNKLHIKGNLGLVEAITYLNENNEATNGNALTDLSAEVDYYITPNIGLWARGNNLLDNRYEALQQYPTAGLNVLGGILIKF